jgi:outer membrane protein OmpA-like peptidoglycan-associated protein
LILTNIYITIILSNFCQKEVNMNFIHLKRIILLLVFLALISGLYAQTKYDFPAGDFWSLDAGIGMTTFLVDGFPLQLIFDPKLWLSPSLMVGSRVGINYSFENETITNVLSDILTLEGQVYLRWNFLRLGGNVNRTYDIFAQGGLGLISAYRGDDNPFDNYTLTRGSILLDAAVGVTIPFTDRWHIEPSIRVGYPHIWGISLTSGYKFKLPERVVTRTTTHLEYVTVDRAPSFNSESVRRIIIPAIEFVLFGPDIGSYNIGIDRDAQQLNELVLNAVTQMLRNDPDLRVRIEGHANPNTINRSETEDLMALSVMRANVVADQLRARGVSDDQIVLIAFGGTRTATNEWDVRNRNRRVELMIIQFDAE